MLRYLLIFCLLISAGTNDLYSTPPTGKIIKGVLVDSVSASLLPSANITLHNNTDSSFITGISTGVNGEFILDNISEGNYYLRISFVGYNTKYIPGINLSKGHL